MEMRRSGQVVIFNFPQTNLEIVKSHLALLVAKLPGNYEDWLISMISSQIHQYIEGMDEVIRQESLAFNQSGLKSKSIIRPAWVAVVFEDILLGSIGEISSERLTRIRENLAELIQTGKLVDKEKEKKEDKDLKIKSNEKGEE
jgi:mRNA interferase MazF